MTTSAASNRHSGVEVVRAAPEQAPLLANLLELYAHDFSEFHSLELSEAGRFGYPPLPLYWSSPDRHAFLVRWNGKPAGLVLVKKGSEVSGTESVWDMAEFFVVRGRRRLGVGTEVAHRVWRKFPGVWEIRVMEVNSPAHRFWARAIATYTGGEVRPVRIERGGTGWMVFSFASRLV